LDAGRFEKNKKNMQNCEISDVDLLMKTGFTGFEGRMTETMESTIFWNVTPCSAAEIRRCFVENYRFHLQTVCLDYSSTLRLEALRSSEIIGNFY
jgi:hypothetical protein